MILKIKGTHQQWFKLESVLPNIKKSFHSITQKFINNKFGAYVYKKSPIQYYLKVKEKPVAYISIIKQDEKEILQVCFYNNGKTFDIDNIEDFNSIFEQWSNEFIERYKDNPFHKQYVRKGIYTIDEVLSKRSFNNHKEDLIEFDGDMIHMNSGRYHTFAEKGLKCVTCGIEGKYFAKESDQLPRYHFNLYALDDEGKEILMTKDHVIPRSKGGKDEVSNYQTMCSKCNGNKGNKMEGE